MSGLLKDCEELFGSTNLYEILEITKDASSNEVKRGYHKGSLRVHPDRVEQDQKEEATRKFQTLGKVYSILSDQDRRAVYDETGEVDDESDIPQDRDWYEYWRLLFAKISVKDIEEFEEKYKESEEELEDLKSAYMDYEGDMEQIMENVLCATDEDEPRFTKILKGLIKKKELPDYKTFTKEGKDKKVARKRRAAKEAKEAEELKEELGVGEMDSLRAMIAQKHSSREKETDNFFSHLEAKYAQPQGKKKGKKSK